MVSIHASESNQCVNTNITRPITEILSLLCSDVGLIGLHPSRNGACSALSRPFSAFLGVLAIIQCRQGRCCDATDHDRGRLAEVGGRVVDIVVRSSDLYATRQVRKTGCKTDVGKGKQLRPKKCPEGQKFPFNNAFSVIPNPISTLYFSCNLLIRACIITAMSSISKARKVKHELLQTSVGRRAESGFLTVLHRKANERDIENQTYIRVLYS